MSGPLDPVSLTADLIRCRSVTPADDGALERVAAALQPAGFTCHLIERGGIRNLYARWGTQAPVFGFNGHTDVVPEGNADSWTVGPFSGEVRGELLWGRGATDMKSGVAAFVAAAVGIVSETPPSGSVALLITGDEEGDGVDGTAAILDWMDESGERLDVCLVGEPTSRTVLGDTVKIGRRGSMTGTLTVFGKQGHTAYPDRAVNPLPALARTCARLAETPLDLGSTHFQASTLALTSIDTGNPANNVVPAAATARFNIRFNDLHTSESVAIWADQIIEEALEGTGCTAELGWQVSGESFLTPPGPFSEIVSETIAARTFERPALTTGGGTSDARFIRTHCPVIEFGLVGDTMHQVDERVPCEDIRTLTAIYREIMERFFGI